MDRWKKKKKKKHHFQKKKKNGKKKFGKRFKKRLKILGALKTEKSVVLISRKLKVSRKAIYHVRKNGVQRKKTKPNLSRRKITPQLAKILTNRLKGKNCGIKKLEKILGVSSRTIRR